MFWKNSLFQKYEIIDKGVRRSYSPLEWVTRPQGIVTESRGLFARVIIFQRARQPMSVNGPEHRPRGMQPNYMSTTKLKGYPSHSQIHWRIITVFGLRTAKSIQRKRCYRQIVASH